MNTQYRKNLKAILEASKTYCDESIESLKWELGTYDLSVDTINGTTMLLPTPTNTIQATMVRIDGKSEVSANLKDLSYPTTSYYRTNSTSFIATQDTSTTRIRTESVPFKASNGAEFYINNIPSGIALLGVGAFDSEQQIISDAVSVSGNKITISVSGVEYIFLLFSGSGFDDTTKTLFNQIGIFKTNIYEPYFANIHNLELSGLKVEGANKYNKVIVQANCYYDNTATKQNNSNFDTYSFEAKPNTSYTISGISQASTTPYFLAYNGDTFISALMYYKSGTFTTPANTTKVIYPIRKVEKDNNIMINEGSTALPFEPYVSTTKTIDLTTIKDGNNNTLFPNGLCGINNYKDTLTPYKATKVINPLNLKTLQQSDFSQSTQGIPTGYNYRFNVNSILALGSTINTTEKIYQNVLWSNCNVNDTTENEVSFTFHAGSYNLILYTKTLANAQALYNYLQANDIIIEYIMQSSIEVSIDFSQLVKFTAHSNGSITLVNTNNQDTTSTFKYLKEVAK